MNKYKIIVSVIYKNFFNKINEFITNDYKEVIRIINTQKSLKKLGNPIDITILKDNEYLFNIEC